MYKVLSLLFIFQLVTTSFGQNVTDRFRLQVYTGGPSLLKSAVKVSNQWQAAVTYTGTPLIGGVFDVHVNSWLSLGIDVSHRSGKIEFDVQDSTLYTQIEEKWDIRLDEYVNPFGHYILKLPRTKVMFNLNFHALSPTSKSDLYFGLGIGYNNMNPKLTLNGNDVAFFNTVGKISLPIAYRTSIGYSYQFTRVFGVFAEFGIGGPIVSGGLNVKF